MQQPLISIIVPVYKVEQYLRRCLDSVVNQNYTNLEIILVDDGSPDNSPQICDEYAAKDKRIIVIHKENGGLSDARNAGTRLATGSYIYYLDSDDELPLDSISIMVECLIQHPEAEIVTGKMYCPQNETLYNQQLFNTIYTFNSNKDLRLHYWSVHNQLPVNACNKLISRKFLLDNNIRFKKGIIHEDNLWTFFVVQKANQIVCTNKNTYIRYLNPNSITTASSEEKKINSWSIILKEVFNNIDSFLFKTQFSNYLNQFNEIIPRVTAHQKISYNSVWESIVDCAKRNHHPLLAALLICHKKFFIILKGHGTGFIIRLILKKMP